MPRMHPPDPSGTPDFTSLIEEAKSYVEALDENGVPPKDGKQYIFEAVMTAIYGPDIWVYIGAKMKDER